MSRKISFIIVGLLLGSISTSAQVEITGSVDVTFKAGGKASGHFTNGIDHDFNHLHSRLQEFNVNMFAPISNEFYIESRLRVKNNLSGKIDPPKLELASINYSPEGKKYFLSAGKIIMPFGFYPNRQMQIDRTFIDYPMSYSYSIYISRTKGWYDLPRGDYGDQNAEDIDYGMQSIFYGGYTTGLLYGWQNDFTTIKAALTNEPATEYDASNIATMAGIARITHTLNMYLTFGVSGAYGSFMHEGEVNSALMNDVDFTQFTQAAVGADFQIGFTFFEIIGEATFSRWHVPYYEDGAGFAYSGINQLAAFNLNNVSANLDIKYEPPFFTGGYFAVRAEHIDFNEVALPGQYNAENTDWDHDISKLTAVIGYKLDRNVLLKIGYSDQGDFNGDAFAFKAYLTAAF